MVPFWNSHIAPHLTIRSALWKSFCSRDPAAQMQTADWEMGLFFPYEFILVFILLPETWKTRSPVLQLPSAGTQAPRWGTASPWNGKGDVSGRKAIPPLSNHSLFFYLPSVSPSPLLLSLLFPYACSSNIYILPHLHICLLMELQSKLSATTKHQKEM